MTSREIQRAAHVQLMARGTKATAILRPMNLYLACLAASIPAGGTGHRLPLAIPLGPGDPGQARSQCHSKVVNASKRSAIDPKLMAMWVAVLRAVVNGWLEWPIHAVTGLSLDRASRQVNVRPDKQAFKQIVCFLPNARNAVLEAGQATAITVPRRSLPQSKQGNLPASMAALGEPIADC